MPSLTAIASGGGSNTSLAGSHSSVSTDASEMIASGSSSGESTKSLGLPNASSGGSTSSPGVTPSSSGASVHAPDLAPSNSGISVDRCGSKDPLPVIKSNTEAGDCSRSETLVSGTRPIEPLQRLQNVVRFTTGGWSLFVFLSFSIAAN